MDRRDSLRSSFGEWMRFNRAQYGLSRNALSERAGVFSNIVGEIESARTELSLEDAERIATAFGYRLSEVLESIETEREMRQNHSQLLEPGRQNRFDGRTMKKLQRKTDKFKPHMSFKLESIVPKREQQAEREE